MENVSKTVASNLCVSCGACSQVCHAEAISSHLKNGLFLPSVSKELCNGCGLCLKVCPSHNVDVAETYGSLDFDRKDADCYIAYSKEDRIRRIGTSGGVISALVYNLLKSNQYEKAYLLKYESFDDNRAILYAVSDPEEVLECAKSKYIPASIEEVIKDIKNGHIGKSIIVATPCQTLAIKRYLNVLKRSDADLLFVGLFCDKTLNYNVYSFYEAKFGPFDSFHFRDKEGNDWPGDTVICQNGEKHIIDKTLRMSLKPYFQLNRCRYCFDKLNQLADISCGDCYILGEESKAGKSSIIVRTEKGKCAIEACQDGIALEPCSFESIKKSQHLEEKKKNVARNESQGNPVFTNFPKDFPNSIFVHAEEEEREKMAMALGADLRQDNAFNSIDKRVSAITGKKKTSKWRKVLRRSAKVFHNPDRSIKILIDNAGFVNKGAELMLISVVQQIEKRLPNAQIVLPNAVYYENPSYCVKHRIQPMKKNSVKLKKMMMNFVYRNILNKTCYITPDQIDVVLDAGGFQFGDQWGHTQASVNAIARYYSAFSKKGRKIIFLSQAFGPFKQETSQKMMKTVYGFADVLYAREQVSYDYLKELFPEGGKIHLCPDFTCLSENKSRRNIVLPDGCVLIVPNAKMITHSDSEVSSNYLSFLKEIIAFLLNRNEKVVLLNHEGEDDELLLEKINANLTERLLLLSNLDALEVKRIIGSAKLLISSRFHGVVSGLTQCIPTLCTSWSHKYYELLKEHGCSNNALDINGVENAKAIIADALENPKEHTTKTGCMDNILSQVNAMWKTVFSMIER